LESININLNSGKSIILLTEAPHNNIIAWASPVYKVTGSLRKMIGTGFHKEEVWYSVLFQLMYILYILQKEEIYFNELSLKNNIYIKDINYDNANIQYLIYSIDELPYYVPLYGYIVLFDSKYSDVDENNFKIVSPKLFPDKNDKKNKSNTDSTIKLDIESLIFNKFKEIFNPHVFSDELRLQGGLPPEESIINFLNDINNEIRYDKDKDIKKYFEKYFKKYLHDRIGTSLTKVEKESVNTINRPSVFSKGTLFVKQERYNEYTWAMYKDEDVGNLKKVFTKDAKNNIIEKSVSKVSLSIYHEYIFPSFYKDNFIEQYFDCGY
jgi:hypothetical protein